jgi:type IV pilus assembly protein PilA
MLRERRSRGFTLLELMIVVGILGILSAVALVAYRRYVSNARRSEVFSMIAALKSAEESYKAEFSTYYGTTATGEEDFYPVLRSGGTEPTPKTFNPASAGKTLWQNLRVSPPASTLYCGYVVVAGAANAFGIAGVRGRTLFNNVPPPRPWYYIRATCDFDGKTTTDSLFETTFDSEIVFTDNEGT